MRTRQSIPAAYGNQAAVAALVAMATAAIADLVHANQMSLAVLVAAPIVTAFLSRSRAVVTIATLSAILALVLPGSLMQQGSVRYVRVLGTIGVDVLSVGAAVLRERLTDARVRLRMIRERRERDRREALEINDTVLQELVTARSWMAMGKPDRASVAVDRALQGAQGLVEDLLGDVPIQPGSLMRGAQARE
ncbi:MAG TPA: hypothetical protein VFP54_01450 [Acidimicrobiales bacterium]|nr:hypothetical protein [Acidimicrobiales bacterium]